MADTWIVRNTERDKEREVDSRAEAEETKSKMVGIGANPDHLEIIPPGGNESETESDSEAEDEPQPAEVVYDESEAEAAPAPAQAPEKGAYDLPEKVPVDTDPLVWMPEEFTDTIEGTVAINRKGFEVLCSHFGVAISTDKEIGPWETDHEYAEVKATATTPEGETYTAYGSARAESGDDVSNLLELADTRAYKRAASRATGVGMVAVPELKTSLG